MIDRRAATALVVATLAGCGGGGGGETGAVSAAPPAPAPSPAPAPAPGPAPAPTPAPAPAPTPAPAPAPTPAPAPAPAPTPAPTPAPAPSAGLSANIAVWGDSITVPISPNLQVLVPGRSVFDGSGIGQTSSQVVARAVANASTRSWIAVFWCGHNNFELGGIDQVVSDIASGVNQLAPANGNRFVVVSMINADRPAGWRGGSEYQTVLNINAQLQAMYPNNYLDARTALVARYNPAIAQDVIDHGHDVVPSSLRYDEIHFRQEGSSYAAQLIRDFIVAKGW